MIFRRLLFMLAGAFALATSAGVLVVALAFALYALVRPDVGPSGAAAVVAGAAVVLMAVLGLALAMAARPPKPKPGDHNLVERLLDFVKAKPVTAIGGAIAAGILAVRNPGYLGSVIRSFVEGEETSRRRRR